MYGGNKQLSTDSVHKISKFALSVPPVYIIYVHEKLLASITIDRC